MIDARDYLNYFRNAEARIDVKLKQIQGLRERLQSLSCSPDQELVSHSRNVTTMAETISMIIDMQNEIDQQTSEILQRKREAYQILDQISPDSASIIEDYYFKRKTARQIGQSLHITTRQTQRRVHNAVEEFQLKIQFSPLQSSRD